MPEGALQRAVELLGRIGEQPDELTVAELASDAGMPTSTAYRLLAELEQHGLVQRGAGRTVALGTRLVALGRTAEEALRERLVEPARGVMEQLSGRLGETAILTAPCGLEGIVLHVVEADEHSVRLSYALYRRAPMHRGASGKILAAYLDPGERARLLEAIGSARLERELDRIRRAGFAYTVGELDAGRRRACGADPRPPRPDRRRTVDRRARRASRSARAIQAGRALCRADDRARLPALTTPRVRVHVAPRERNDLRLSCHLERRRSRRTRRGPGAADRPSPAPRQARRQGPRPRCSARPGGAEPRRAVERRLWARGDHGRAVHGRRVGAAVHAADHARDHGDAGAAGDLLLPGDHRASRRRWLLRGLKGEPRALAGDARGGLAGRRLRADGGGQPRRRCREPRAACSRASPTTCCSCRWSDWRS